MPDRRSHRGQHPEDATLFADKHHPTLRLATAELSWLRSRGYAEDSALKLVGDRYALTARQRMAVRRSSCADDALEERSAKRVDAGAIAGRPIGIDGYNVLITIESALSHGLILVGRDGCLRDLASVHGTYRKVQETAPAVELLIDAVTALAPSRVDWYFDQPVSNSGRLRALILERLEARDAGRRGPASWNIELVPAPDKLLADYAGVVATSDSVILDRCGAWFNLAGVIVAESVPDAWIVELRSGGV